MKNKLKSAQKELEKLKAENCEHQADLNKIKKVNKKLETKLIDILDQFQTYMLKQDESKKKLIERHKKKVKELEMKRKASKVSFQNSVSSR